MKKILCCGVFNPALICQASPMCGDNVFAKGFEANNYEVTRFDYRATKTPNEDLLSASQQKQYDMFYFGKCETILPSTLATLKKQNKNAIFIKFGADVRDNPTAHDLGHNEYIDFFFATYGGDYLKAHFTKNMKVACSILTFTDSDYYSQQQVDDKYKTDVLWTGRKGFGDNAFRNKVIDQLLEYKQLKEFYNIRMFGIDEEWIGSPDYVRYINGTKIGVGINSFNRVKYSSDRLGNYMSSGSFYLAHHFKGIEECFDRGIHLDWFHNLYEFKDKIDYYLNNDDIRQNIANRGQQRVLKYFDYAPLVKNILHVIEHSKSTYSWDDIFTN